MAVFEGDGAAGNARRYLLIVARFNRWVTDRLLAGARAELKRRGAADSQVDVAWVPGSFELPVAAKAAAATGRYAAIACLGAVLKGETAHDVHIAQACAAGIADVAVTTGVPVAFGVVTAETFEQAEARSRTDGGRNIGADAAAAAVETAAVLAQLRAG